MLKSLIGGLKRITIGDEAIQLPDGSPSDSEEESAKISVPQVKTGISMKKSEEDRTAEPHVNGKEEDDDSEPEIVRSRGTITALDDETGKAVIDRQFKVDVNRFAVKNVKFKRGCIVDFEAFRTTKNPQWIVTSMTLYQNGLEKVVKKETPKPKPVIAKVIRVTSEFVEVEAVNPRDKENPKIVQIPTRPELSVGFTWKRGDQMQIQLEHVASGGDKDKDFFELPESVVRSRIQTIAPVQRRTVVGKVTKRHQDFLIDDSIYFTPDVCPTKAGFPSGAVVKCEAISSDQYVGSSDEELVKWRAISVEKSNFLHYTGMDPSSDFAGDWQIDEVGKVAINRHHDLMQDKCGIKIHPKYLNFPPLLIGTSSVKTITINNTSEQTYGLHGFYFNQDASVCQFEIKSPGRELSVGSITLLPGDEVVFEVFCKPLMIGKTTEMCVFDFGGFMIARNFTVIGRASEEETLVIDTARGRPNFKKQIGEQDISKIIADRERKRIRGSQIVRAPFFSQKRLPLNKVPKELFQIMKDQDEKRLQSLYPDALKTLQFDNYKQKFQVGLWFEEIENDLRRRQYDLHGVRLERFCQNPVQYRFYAPGIQDFQPPVNIQDTIDAFDVDCETNAKFQGTIMKITDDEVVCIFGDAFDQQYTGFPLTIQFNLGRTNYKRCHFAVQTAVEFLGESFLFPEDNIEVKSPRILTFEDDEYPEDAENGTQNHYSSNGLSNGTAYQMATKSKPEPSSTSIFRKHKPTEMFNANGVGDSGSTEIIGRRVQSVRSHFVSDTPSAPSCSTAQLKWFKKDLNEEQKDAVRRILRGQARPLPYVIYGPPGTGKTVALVEAIMQVNKLDKNSRILVCAPSNAAADVIAQYLAESNQYQPGDFVRLNGFLRAGSTMLDIIAPFCTDGENLNSVAMNRLIITTCMTAGQFFSLDLSIGHFTHVFIDEAGYCTEPEALVPTILLALSKGGQLILAGDPNQLGPVLMSDVSQNIMLNRSFLERLMTRKLYCRDQERFPKEKYNPLVLTKLVKNYRAHPTLLKLPSRLFYDDDLVSRAPYEEAVALCQDPSMKNILVTEGVPLIFHGVQGTCTRERDSPSWCNKAEAVQVVHYVTTLLGKCGLRSDDIGIITPYRKQVEKIRLALQMNLSMNEDQLPKVASVEEFQGGERKVIIISTVRSANEDRIESQLERLGFLYQPKRFNVVITRAKALMIVVGNPFVLSKNNFWLQLLRYALDLNAYKGCNLPIHLDKKMRTIVQQEKPSNSRSRSNIEVEEEERNENDSKSGKMNGINPGPGKEEEERDENDEKLEKMNGTGPCTGEDEQNTTLIKESMIDF